MENPSYGGLFYPSAVMPSPTDIEEITEPPKTTATVSALEGTGAAVNRTLADRLQLTHRVAHRIRIRRNPPKKVPVSLSPEEKLLRAIFGEQATGELPEHLDDTGIVKQGTVVTLGMRLIQNEAEGNVNFASAPEGTVTEVRRTSETADRKLAETVEVIVEWSAALTTGDRLSVSGNRRVVIGSILDDGKSEPLLYLGRAERDLVAGTGDRVDVTRMIPTAAQRLQSRGIGPYSLVSQRPITGEPLGNAEVRWLASHGLRSILTDFASHKGDSVTLRVRVYENIVKGEPVPDPWSERRKWAEELAARERAPAPAPPAGGLRDIFSFFTPPGNEPPTEAFANAVAWARLFGVELALDGRAIVPRPAFPGRDPSWSHGEVKKPDTLNLRTLTPEPGGLFCQKIFGPLLDYECACGKYKRMKFRGTVCESCGVEVIGSKVRRTRFGHFNLPCPVVPVHLRPLLASILGDDPAPAIESIARDGGAELEQRLRSAGSAPGGIAPLDLLWSTLPVLPPDLRPLIPLPGGRFATSDLNDLYRRVINRANRLRRLMELGAPQTILADERATLQRSVDQLLFNSGRQVITRPGDAPPGSRRRRTRIRLTPAIDLLRSSLRRDGVRRMDYSGRAVTLVGTRTELPLDVLFDITRPFLYSLAEQKGLVTTIKSAKAMMNDDAVRRREFIEEVLATRPFLFANGDPGRAEVIAAGMVTIGEGPVIRLSADLARRIGVTTGDETVVHLPISATAVEEARALCEREPEIVRSVSSRSWIASLPDDPVHAAESLVDAAIDRREDAGADPVVAMLLGGYELD